MVSTEKDEELALFLEMRRREKDIHLRNSIERLDALPLTAASHASRTLSSGQPRRTAAEKFLYAENEKSDIDWLITPPGTPIVPPSEKESQKTFSSQREMPTARSNILKSRLANFQEEHVSRSNIASKHTLTSSLYLSSTVTKRPLSSGGPQSANRPATPPRRPTLPTTTRPSRSATPTGRATLPSTTRSSRPSTPTGRATLPSTTRSSRPSTPTSRATLPTLKPVPPSVRSLTPTRSTGRSSTPNSRSSLPASKSTSRPSTPTRRLTSSLSTPTASAPSSRSSSVTRSSLVIPNKPAPSNGNSPVVKSNTWKLCELPGFSFEAPPNLKTSVPERSISASRGRPGGPSGRSSSVDPGSNGRVRRQSCSPTRGRAPIGNSNGTASPSPSVRRAHSSNTDNGSHVVNGTKMAERVVNTRRLATPKQDGTFSTRRNSGGKSYSSLDSSSFGSTFSRKTLDVAMRNIDMRRTIGGDLRPHITNIPASSMYSVRSRSTKSRTLSLSDSPHATSSIASSDPSVNNNPFCLDGSELGDNDFESFA